MCYAKKLTNRYDEDLGEKFNGQFDCARFNCSGCNESFVDGEAPKRNQNLKKILLSMKFEQNLLIFGTGFPFA